MGKDILMDFSIKALRNGDERAFELLYQQFYQALCYFAERIIKDDFAAKEIVQEVFVKLWERKKSSPDIQSFKSYLFTATRNRCLNYIENRQRKQQREQEYSYFAPLSEEKILRDIIRAEVLREITLAIDQLPLQCRKVINMTYSDGKTADEIAAEMDIAVSTVRNQKARGLGLLKKLLSHPSFVILLALMR